MSDFFPEGGGSSRPANGFGVCFRCGWLISLLWSLSDAALAPLTRHSWAAKGKALAYRA